MYTEISEIRRIQNRIQTEKEDLKKDLEALTTGNSGILHDIKIAVDESSELGQAVGNLGGKVLQAQTVVIDKIDDLLNIVAEHLAKEEANLEEAELKVNYISGQIDSIDFTKGN